MNDRGTRRLWRRGCVLGGVLLLAAGALWLATNRRARSDDATDAATTAAESTEGRADRNGEDWPKFLGPRETGVSGETGLLETWPADGPPVLWKKKVGTGYSAPSIRGDRLVLHHREGDEEIVECFRPDDGTPVWKFSYDTSYEDPYGYNNGPRCTPILTEDRCYTYGAEGKLLCLDLASGKKIWMRDVLADFNLTKPGSGVPNWFFGVGCTPVLEGDLLITLVGGQPNSGVVAFEAATGKTRWQNVGKNTWDGADTDDPSEPKYKWTGDEQVVGYSSPIVATIHGKRHALCLVRQGLVSLDPATGEENFKYWFKSPTFESVNAARPLVVGDTIFITAAYRTGSAMLRVKEDGKSVEEIYRDKRNMLAHWSTPIHVDGRIYGFSGRHENEAELRCIDAKTGKVLWKADGSEPVRDSIRQDQFSGGFRDKTTGKAVAWPFYGRGSMILADGRFIVLGERGTLALIELSENELKEISRTFYREIHYPAWAAPVLSRKRLYLRCEDALVCVDLMAK